MDVRQCSCSVESGAVREYVTTRASFRKYMQLRMYVQGEGRGEEKEST